MQRWKVLNPWVNSFLCVLKVLTGIYEYSIDIRRLEKIVNSVIIVIFILFYKKKLKFLILVMSFFL